MSFYIISFQLFKARNKVAQNVEDEEDRAIWEHMSSNIMSDQESEGQGAGKKVLFKRPHWRSAQANDIIERIDEVFFS